MSDNTPQKPTKPNNGRWKLGELSDLDAQDVFDEVYLFGYEGVETTYSNNTNVEAADVFQGLLSDCYLMASLLAMEELNLVDIGTFVDGGVTKFYVQTYALDGTPDQQANCPSFSTSGSLLRNGYNMARMYHQDDVNPVEVWTNLYELAWMEEYDGTFASIEYKSAKAFLEHFTSKRVDIVFTSFGSLSDEGKYDELNTVINDSDYTILLHVDSDYWKDEEDISKKEPTHVVLATSASDPGYIEYRNPWDGSLYWDSDDTDHQSFKVEPLQESDMSKVNGYYKIYNNVDRT